MRINELARLIEMKRQQLLKLASQHGMDSDITLQNSHQLDSLINEYNRLINEKDNNN